MAEPTTEPLTSVAEADELPKTKEKLDELTRAAALQYSLKNFAAAADHYADAVEIQAELNGEMAPDNAELLFYYGRALYKVAVAKSDVLGNKVAQEDQKKKKKAKANKDVKPQVKAEASHTKSTADTTAPKPASTYFQLTGDENWDDSDDDEEEDADDEADAEQEDEQDDFGYAYETFELARVLYQKQLDAQVDTAAAAKDKGKGPTTLSENERAIKEKLADCHGFLVDISLENERFHDAVADARSALALQQELHPFSHENVTEAHYSLSLALEFASVSKIRQDQAGADRQQDPSTTTTDDKDDKDGINWPLRTEALTHTDLAIQSLRARLTQEETAFTQQNPPHLSTPQQRAEKAQIIEEKKSLLDELLGRSKELKLDPTNHLDYDSIDQSVVQGLFGSLLGVDKRTQGKVLEEAKRTANDVSQVVRKKVKKGPVSGSGSGSGSGLVVAEKGEASGKRKFEGGEEGVVADGKRSRTEDAG